MLLLLVVFVTDVVVAVIVIVVVVVVIVAVVVNDLVGVVVNIAAHSKAIGCLGTVIRLCISCKSETQRNLIELK